MFNKLQTNRISRTLNLLAILLPLIAIPSSPLQAQQPSQPSTAPRPELALQIGHRSFIYHIALSPDGKTAASVSQDGTLKIWDTQTGDLLDTFTFPKGKEIGLETDKMVYSTNGQAIEFHRHSFEGVKDATKQSEYNVKTKELRQLSVNKASICPDQAELVAVSPDGRMSVCRQVVITTANTNGLMPDADFFLWELQTKQKAPITKENHWFDSPAFDFSPDGRVIAIYSGRYASNVVFWDVTTRKVKRHLENVFFRGFSTDGQTIVLQIERANRCACPEDDKLLLSDKAKFGAVELWDMQLRAPKRTLIGREFFGYTPDGQTILLTKKTEAETTATMELWDAQLSRLKQTLKGNLPSFSRPLYSSNGRMMALPSETNLASETGREEVILYDLQAEKMINRLPTGSTTYDKIAFSQDGATFTTLSWSGEAKLWDARIGALRSTLRLTRQKVAESPGDSSEAHFSLQETAFSDDGQLVIAGTEGGAVVILNFRTGRVVQTVARSSDYSPVFSIADQTIIQAEPNLPKMVWDLRTLQPHPKPPDGSEKPREESTMTFSNDGRLGAKLSDNHKSATLYDGQTGKQLHALNGHAGAISIVIFAPDNRTVATVSGLPLLNEMSNAALALTAVFSGDKKSELDAELDKLAGDRTIKLWDTQTGLLKQTLQCEGFIHQVRVPPNGLTFIATHSETAKGGELMEANGFTVWDAQTGKAIKTIKADPNASFLLSPDGTLAISRSSEEVKAWDARTGELKWKHSEIQIPILNDASFTPDGKLLVAGTKYQDLNATVKLLDAQTGQLRWSLPVRGFTAFSPDGQTLVCYNFEQATFWDLGTGKLKWSTEGQKTRSPQNPLLANGKLAAVYGQHYAIELRDARDGKLLVSLLTLPGAGQKNERGEIAPEWIAFTLEGYYSASPGAARFIRWRVGDKLLPAEAYAKEFNRPDLVQKALQSN